MRNYLLFYTGPRDHRGDDGERLCRTGRAGGQGKWLTRSPSGPTIVQPDGAPDDVLRRGAHRQALRPWSTALRDVRPAPAQRARWLGLLGDNGRGQVDADQDHLGLPESRDSGSMLLHGQPYETEKAWDERAGERHRHRPTRDLALIDELSVYHNLFLRRERLLRPLPVLNNRRDEA